MKTKFLAGLLGAFLTATASVAHAQPLKKVARIAYVVGRAGPMEFDEKF